jgi:hypothetical protein
MRVTASTTPACATHSTPPTQGMGGADQAEGPASRGLPTGPLAAVDGRGLPVRLPLIQGRASDQTTAPDPVGPPGHTGAVIGQRG